MYPFYTVVSKIQFVSYQKKKKQQVLQTFPNTLFLKLNCGQ